MRALLITLASLAGLSAGCASLTLPPNAGSVVAPAANPLFLPTTNHELAWQAIVDSVDDFFRIHRERRVTQVANVLTPGRIDTLHETQPTLLEPHRWDEAGRRERWEATIKTLRRYATVNVTPHPGGLLVEVIVTKEQELLPRPERSTAGGATLRHDGSIDRQPAHDRSARTPSYWYPIGRDVATEQLILNRIQSRAGAIGGAPAAVVVPLETAPSAPPQPLPAPATP